MQYLILLYIHIQSNLSQGNSEIGSHHRWSLNTSLIDMKCTVKGNNNYGQITQVIAKGCSIKTYEVPGEGTLIFGQPPKEAIY